MSIEVAIGTPLADALNMAIQTKIAELGWAGPGNEGASMAEYFVLMLANGKSEAEIAAEISGDLLGLGPDNESVPAFARWLFEQIAVLNAQMGSEPAPPAAGSSEMDAVGDDTMEGTFDLSMETDAPAINAPTGPKAMRAGGVLRGGREKRIVSHINRALDRSGQDVLHRVRGQSGNERIGRGPPNGPRMGVGRQPRTTNARATNIAAGLANMNGMPGAPGPMGPMNGMNPMNGAGGFVQPDIYAIMEQQNRMLQQMQQQLMMQQQQAHQNGNDRGKSLFDRTNRGGNQFRRGGGHFNGNGPHHHQQQQPSEGTQGETAQQGEDVEMGVAKREAPNPEETVCRYNLRCGNKECKFAHQSPAAPPGITVDVKDVCTFGVACKNWKCTARHPSPASKVAHQSEQDCKFFPNCSNPHCPFRHPAFPACRNGGECKIPNCKFTHVKTACKFHPCTNRNCPFLHEEGQRGTFQDKVWTADGSKEHVSDRKFVNENAQEDLVLPGSEQQPDDVASPEVVV
ncbi:hypothetical protein B0T21DRAFT_335615 [Apiosordaria backusii]|uniref:Nab2-like CCCH zinc finger domain-containing protein n=1 Tax=Apiosordaria backusii TaxID=314023 RepID=A0AA40B7I0_9PEZI|nr:hypothetical protein B0T21DRAFT_335615 [Apiosordaria backusii]